MVLKLEVVHDLIAEPALGPSVGAKLLVLLNVGSSKLLSTPSFA